MSKHIIHTKQKQIKVGIIGGAGYTGGELLRLLVHHPNVTISFAFSRSNGGKKVSAVHTDLIGDTDLIFTNDTEAINKSEIDVLFLCVGHGEAKKFLTETKVNDQIRIIDLSQDFRLKSNNKFQDRVFVYGLPELNKGQILKAKNIANPGCFATGIQLGLLPLAKEGLLEEVYTKGITGSTGAGQGLSPTSHFSWRANNIQAYKTLNHQHLKEIYQSLHQLQSGFSEVPIEDGGISFVPWRGDFTRGIFISSTLTCKLKINQLQDLYQAFYQDQPFTIYSKEEIFLKQVINTNKCVIHIEKVGSKIVVHSAIDNLLKGASGQAVQNMNLMFGLDECQGLQLKSIAF